MTDGYFFKFNDVSTKDFNVGIRGAGLFNAPKRVVEHISVDGRNGDLTIDKGHFENIDVTYSCYIISDFDRNISGFRDAMLANVGYCRLEDNIHPDEYRIAELTSSIDVDVYGIARAGEFDLTFSCKPQRFLKSGEKAIEMTGNGRIINPTNQEAKPLIRVYGTGTLGIGSNTVTITAVDEYVDIDCDIMDAYKGTVNCNGNISLSNGVFPTLHAGVNNISLQGISRIEIIPRWWRL